MGFLKNLFNRANERKEKLKELEEDQRIIETVEKRKLSHNERELMKNLEEEKEKLYKEALYWENRKRMALERKKSSDMMKFNPEFFNDSSVLKQKNIFKEDNDDFLYG